MDKHFPVGIHKKWRTLNILGFQSYSKYHKTLRMGKNQLNITLMAQLPMKMEEGNKPILLPFHKIKIQSEK